MSESSIAQPLYLRPRPAAHRRSDDRRYGDRKARGLCVGCGLVAPVAGRVRCDSCLQHRASVARSQPSYPSSYVVGSSSLNKGGEKVWPRKRPERPALPAHPDRGEVCAICGDPPSKGRKLAIDHCHATGVVRGFLCSRCNLGLGYFRDGVESLLNAAAYLRRWRTAAVKAAAD